MIQDEALVERVSLAIWEEAKKVPRLRLGYGDAEQLARAAISAMQSDPIPIYRLPDATDEALAKFGIKIGDEGGTEKL